MYLKIFGCIAVVLILLAAGWLFQMRVQRSSHGSTPAPSEKGRETYLGLRKLALTVTSARTGLKNNIGPDTPVAVLMDINTGNGNATIVAYADGAASIYLGNGGGYIGGGEGYPSVRAAGQNLLAVASKFQPKMQKTQQYPLPKAGEVFFYVVTDNGVYTVSAPEAELNRRTHPLTPLYAAGQEVITQYRINSPKP